MKGIHPSTKIAVWCAFAAAALGVAGCRSSSSSGANPFMAPDRVPAPSTRAIAPGQAQPYYQGDPLPVMQSSTSAASNPAWANNATTLSSTGKTLAWNAPASTSSDNPATKTNSPWDAKSRSSAPLAYGNEPPVSVPSDGGDLRFAAPATSPPSAASSGLVAQSTVAPQPPSTAAAAATVSSNQGVAQASYNAPVSGGLTPVVTTPELSPTPQSTSPWRTPQVGTTAAPTGYQVPAASAPSLGVTAPTTMIPPVPLYVMGQPPTVLPTNVMPVEMRAVPAPPPQPGDPMPRVRIPTYDVPQTATADGFRPRSSMR